MMISLEARPLRVLFLGTTCAIAALGHYTWISASPDLFEAGKKVAVQIAHGHLFPESEGAINASQVRVFVVAPSGAKTELKAVAAEKMVTAEFSVKESGFHRVVMVQDRGVNSRTPDGVKPGGRDQNPNATQAFRTFRTAVAYTRGAKPAAIAGKPLGLEFELTASLANGVWTVQVLKQGKPVADSAIELLLAGAEKPAELGKTGAGGKVTYRVPAGAKGAGLFLARLREPAPSGAAYDTVNYETSLHVTW
jgi:uncharacterized GH25 family protein